MNEEKQDRQQKHWLQLQIIITSAWTIFGAEQIIEFADLKRSADREIYATLMEWGARLTPLLHFSPSLRPGRRRPFLAAGGYMRAAGA